MPGHRSQAYEYRGKADDNSAASPVWVGVDWLGYVIALRGTSPRVLTRRIEHHQAAQLRFDDDRREFLVI